MYKMVREDAKMFHLFAGEMRQARQAGRAAMDGGQPTRMRSHREAGLTSIRFSTSRAVPGTKVWRTKSLERETAIRSQSPPSLGGEACSRAPPPLEPFSGSGPSKPAAAPSRGPPPPSPPARIPRPRRLHRARFPGRGGGGGPPARLGAPRRLLFRGDPVEGDTGRRLV
uniref:Uncharacterized protein n=1 Tax=Sphaerodactylus townsendi TaxID=933632 RepID=A0ACB8E730_9SAUR